MTSSVQNRIILTAALLLPWTVSLWVVATLTVTTPSTFVIFAGVVLTTAAIMLNTLKNGQGAGSVAQRIHTTDSSPSAARHSVSRTRTASARDAWEARGPALDAAGRARAALALGVALTLVVLYVGLA